MIAAGHVITKEEADTAFDYLVLFYAILLSGIITAIVLEATRGTWTWFVGKLKEWLG